MINKIILFLFAAGISAQAIALNNPFNKTSSVDVGTDVKWNIKNGIANKTSSEGDRDDTYYQLRLTKSKLILRLVSSVAGNAKKFDQLAIEDVQLDGKTSTLFAWCLKNQGSHSRFLQQGLKVKKEICQNKGNRGEFVMKLNQATYNLLQKTKNITFVVKPYRSAVIVSFDVPNLSKVYAQIKAVKQKPVTRSVEKFISKPVRNIKPVAPPVAIVKPKPKPKPVKICSIKPPSGFAKLKAVKYKCNSTAEKSAARKSIAASVLKARAIKSQLEKEKYLKSKEYLAKQKKLEEEKKREADVISKIEQNTNKLRDEVSKRMIGMCQKKWADGESRCYCEPYLEFAPAGIKSDASCAGG